MPRISEQRISAQPQQGQQQGGRQVRSQVFASGQDNVPSYIPDMKDPELDGFIGGLAKLQPALEAWKHKEEQADTAKGSIDRQTGLAQQSSSDAYRAAYFGTDGLVRAQEDGASLMERYKTEFDKDKGDLEGWLRENHQGRLTGVTDENYLQGYQKGITPAFQAIRGEHLAYQKKAVVDRVESNAMQMVDNGVRAYVTHGMPIPEGYVEAIEKHVGENLGVSKERFQELLFESVRKVGAEGRLEAFDVLKKERPDGSPGLYYNPTWKHKIDEAEQSAYNVAHKMAQDSRDRRQNEALYGVFAEEDPKKAQAMFLELKKNGLFTRADDLIKWDKLLTEKVDGKPDVRQLENEGNMLAKVYQGGLSFKDILKAQSSGEITSGQRKYLLGEVRKVQTENRTLAAQEGKAADQIYKTMDFRAADEFLGQALKPRPKDANDFMGVGSEYDRQALAMARLELVKSAKGKSPAEVQPIVEDIVKRNLKRREDAKNGGYTESQKEAVGKGNIPFNSIQEVRDKAHLLSPAELKTYINHFKGNNGR